MRSYQGRGATSRKRTIATKNKATSSNKVTWGSIIRSISFENVTYQAMRRITICAAAVFLLFSIVLSINLFVSANQQAKQAAQIEQILSETTSIAETLKASDGDLNFTAQSLRTHTHYSLTDNSLILFYNDTFTPCAESDAFYRAAISVEVYTAHCTYTIRFSEIEGKRDLHTMEFKYLRGGEM